MVYKVSPAVPFLRFFFRLKSNSTPARSAAAPRRAPITIPATAPFDKPPELLAWGEEVEEDEEAGIDVGADVSELDCEASGVDSMSLVGA